jgi:hypothetical protein
MSGWKHTVDMAEGGADTVRQIAKFLNNKEADLEFHFQKLQGYAHTLFKRFAPFKPGDRVVLKKTPVIGEDQSHGWLGSKHFLVAGAKGTVKFVDCYNGVFEADVVFDDETWIDHEGKQHPMQEKKMYTITEEYLA